jgi:hypothetical protein
VQDILIACNMVILSTKLMRLVCDEKKVSAGIVTYL